MNATIAMLLGIAIGLSICLIFFAIVNRPAGTLKIDHTDPGKDVYRFEFNKFEDFSKKKIVIVSVDNDADLSQK